MPLSLSEIVLDPDVGEKFSILRTSGTFQQGGWVQNKPRCIRAFGIVAVATPQALLQVPEGDRVEGSIQVIAAQPIYETLAKYSATSDRIEWQGDLYRVQSVAPWKMAGYWSAILVRTTGD